MNLTVYAAKFYQLKRCDLFLFALTIQFFKTNCQKCIYFTLRKYHSICHFGNFKLYLGTVLDTKFWAKFPWKYQASYRICICK